MVFFFPTGSKVWPAKVGTWQKVFFLNLPNCSYSAVNHSNRNLTFVRMSLKVNVRIINKSSNDLPTYATEGSAGMDIRADLSGPLVLKSLERQLIPTGLFIELPLGYEAQIRPRSGLAIKHGITCLNTPGTIDSDYRGEIKVILINLSGEEQTLHPGDRIAQMVIASVEQVEWDQVETISETVRSAGGFGHTGKQ
jgi:dUTP pyrophosphatase